MTGRAVISQDSEERTLSAEENASCSSSNGTKRTCTTCGTSKTPLWRGGPAGPKSLCNACGIKSRKKRQAAGAGLNLRTQEKKQRKIHKITKNLGKNMKSKVSRNDCKNKLGNLLKRKSLDLRREKKLMKRKLWRMLGEEEQAAILLMSLSCASVYA